MAPERGRQATLDGWIKRGNEEGKAGGEGRGGNKEGRRGGTMSFQRMKMSSNSGCQH